MHVSFPLCSNGLKKKLSLWPKTDFTNYNLFFFATQCPITLDISKFEFCRSNNQSLKNQRFTSSGCKDIWRDYKICNLWQSIAALQTKMCSAARSHIKIEQYFANYVFKLRLETSALYFLNVYCIKSNLIDLIWWSIFTKELSLCHKLWFSNLYIFKTQCRRP